MEEKHGTKDNAHLKGVPESEIIHDRGCSEETMKWLIAYGNGEKCALEHGDEIRRKIDECRREEALQAAEKSEVPTEVLPTNPNYV